YIILSQLFNFSDGAYPEREIAHFDSLSAVIRRDSRRYCRNNFVFVRTCLHGRRNLFHFFYDGNFVRLFGRDLCAKQLQIRYRLYYHDQKPKDYEYHAETQYEDKQTRNDTLSNIHVADTEQVGSSLDRACGKYGQ